MASPCEVPVVNIKAACGATCRRKDGKHEALIVVGKMKKTVPGEQAVISPAEREHAHIDQMPLSMGKPLPAGGNQRWGAVHSVDGEFSINQISRDRLAETAADVEYCPGLR
jgi:hypothetical protein